MHFTVFPAIDLRGGRCVRLRQGDPGAETVFGADPAAMAQRWASAGAQWLHVVNLDGALEDEQASLLNLNALLTILQAVPLPVQFGGGLRSVQDIARVLEIGVARVVLGTAIVTRPSLVTSALQRFGPERIVAGLDARDGKVAIRGWQEVTDLDAVELGRQLKELGVLRALYTDIARDGMLSGPNVAATRRLAGETGLSAIASGGVGSLEDVRALVAAGDIEGVVIGQALYTGAFTLESALAAAEAS
jgi:phosphoribosylformimino-5-aminoimidazole carboxamide ribotide isomerase